MSAHLVDHGRIDKRAAATAHRVPQPPAETLGPYLGSGCFKMRYKLDDDFSSPISLIIKDIPQSILV